MTSRTQENISFWQAWMNSFRPKTLSIFLLPVAAGVAAAPIPLEEVRWSLFFSLLFTCFFLQMGTNFINDACDFVRGADTDERIGQRRLIQCGILTARTVYAMGFMFFFLSVLSSIPFIAAGGKIFLFFVFLSILSGYLYTAGPYPLAYVGGGEIFVIGFFGLMATLSSYYFQTGEIQLAAIIPALQLGFLAAAVLALNNLRDIYQDRKANKMTFIARFGISFGRVEVASLLLLPYLLNLVFILEGNFLKACLPFFSLPMAINIIRGIFRHSPSRIYNRYFQEAGLLHLSFGSLVIISARLS